MPLSLSGADIEYGLRKPLQLHSVAASFLTSHGHVDFFACSNIVTINTKPYIWNYIEYNNELTYRYSTPHKEQRGKIIAMECRVNVKLSSSYTDYDLVTEFSQFGWFS